MSIFSRKNKKEDSRTEVKKEPVGLVEKEAPPKETQKNTFVPKVVSRLIIRPLITEKATSLEANSQYVFIVAKNANKNEVKKEVERLFDVKVKNVNIINKKKKRRVWRGKVGFTPGHKKAVVTLVEGDKIEVLPH